MWPEYFSAILAILPDDRLRCFSFGWPSIRKLKPQSLNGTELTVIFCSDDFKSYHECEIDVSKFSALSQMRIDLCADCFDDWGTREYRGISSMLRCSSMSTQNLILCITMSPLTISRRKAMEVFKSLGQVVGADYGSECSSPNLRFFV